MRPVHNGLDETSTSGARRAQPVPPLIRLAAVLQAPRKGRIAMAVAIAASALLTGCGGASNPFPTPSSTPPPQGSASPSPHVLDLKPVIGGLLDRNGPPPPSYLSSLAGFVVNVYWMDLQPVSGATLAADNAIDQAITEVRSLNATVSHASRSQGPAVRRRLGPHLGEESRGNSCGHRQPAGGQHRNHRALLD